VAVLFDIFGFLSVVLRGLGLAAETMAAGGALFAALLLAPLGPALGAAAPRIARISGRLIRTAAAFAIAIGLAHLAFKAAFLADTAGVPFAAALGADFVLWGALGIAGAALLFAAGGKPAKRAPILLLGAVAVVAASVSTTHAWGRVDDRAFLSVLSFAHKAGAALWLGGIPCFLAALACLQDARAIGAAGRRFTRMAMAGVALILVAGLGMALRYIDSWSALYATAYGLMVSAKAVMLGVLLCLGALNFARVERVRRDPGTSPLRLRRLAEAELGIGLAVLFAAASITSAPPSVDVVAADRPSLAAVVERMTPRMPDLSGPYYVDLATKARHTIPLSEAARLNADAVAQIAAGGAMPAYDIAWSEFNHHWSGVFVTALGLLALAHRSGQAPWARHWPFLFVALAVGIFLIADPEYWPVGPLPFIDGFLSAEVLQHRLVFVVVAAFGAFEWAVRAGRLHSSAAAQVFPLATGLGGALLLLHSHSVANVKEELLIEWTHVTLALLGLFAGAARWLELRLAPEDRRIPSLVWPVCFVLVGLLLLFYREYD